MEVVVSEFSVALMTGCGVAAGVCGITYHIFGTHSLSKFVEGFIIYCETIGSGLSEKKATKFKQCAEILDKGLKKQSLRNKNRHPDRGITGTLYKEELFWIINEMEKIKLKVERKNPSYSKQIDLKVKQFSKRCAPLTRTLLI